MCGGPGVLFAFELANDTLAGNIEGIGQLSPGFDYDYRFYGFNDVIVGSGTAIEFGTFTNTVAYDDAVLYDAGEPPRPGVSLTRGVGAAPRLR
jgi:hypothetical protein